MIPVIRLLFSALMEDTLQLPIVMGGRGQLMRRAHAHKDSVYSVAFMPDGKGLVSGSWDRP
jgi:WD40 repeat protein